MMTEVVKVLKDRQVVPTPLMTAVCTRHVPAALRDQLLRKLGEPPSPKGTTDASKQSTFKGTQRLQKQKKMKKIQKLKEAAEESSTNAASEVQGSDAADSSDQGHRQMKQETKKNAVKCGI